jgi:hypothetical protein
VSDAREPEAEVPASLGSGVFANDIEVFRDVDYTMLDFVWIDPAAARAGAGRRAVRRFCVMHTEAQARVGGSWMRYDYGRIAYSYKMKRRELTPDDKEWLRRWRERRDAELRRRYPQYFRD